MSKSKNQKRFFLLGFTFLFLATSCGGAIPISIGDAPTQDSTNDSDSESSQTTSNADSNNTDSETGSGDALNENEAIEFDVSGGFLTAEEMGTSIAFNRVSLGTYKAVLHSFAYGTSSFPERCEMPLPKTVSIMEGDDKIDADAENGDLLWQGTFVDSTSFQTRWSFLNADSEVSAQLSCTCSIEAEPEDVVEDDILCSCTEINTNYSCAQFYRNTAEAAE